MIHIEHLSFQFRNGKGIFDLNFEVEKGEVFGYLGPNGAGKTTTIRNLLGFLQPQKGNCRISTMNCWNQAPQIQKLLGYIPGEIAFFDGMKGMEFLHFLADMRGLKKNGSTKQLIERFDLDPSGSIRRMSKGMKQKLGIVAAFMHDPDVLILDEPTSGLDPLMQNEFIKLINEEKQRGKTILMSSHSFEEIDRTCDRAGIIRAGRLVAVESVTELKSRQQKSYIITLHKPEDAECLKQAGFLVRELEPTRIEVRLQGEVDALIQALSALHIKDLEMRSQSLENVFMHYYGEEAAQ